MTGKLLRLACLMFAACMVIAGSSSTAAADVTVTSAANPVRVSVNSRIDVSITVSGPDALSAGAPILEDTADFTVVGPSGTSQQISIMNGQATAVKTYHYVFIPERTGSFTIGGARVTAGDVTYEARGTQVEVVDGQVTSPAPGQSATPDQGSREPSAAGSTNLFIQATADKTEAYVGEQITYTFELYSRLGNLRNTEYEPPSTTGFWAVNLPDVPTGTSVVNNLIYQVSTVKTALFPTTSGEFTIGTARLAYTTGGFFSATQGRTLESKPITVAVKPLPSRGKPEHFSGAVGEFRIYAAIDRTELTTADVVTVRVTVAGTGNLDLISELSLPDLSEFRSYDPRISKTISNSGYRVGGAKTWEYILMPLATGEMIIEPFAVSFFNPEDGEYHIVETEPITLKVSPGSPATGGNIATAGNHSTLPGGASDIRYIKPDRSSLDSTSRHLYNSPLFFGAYAIPLFLFVTAFVVKRRRDTIEGNTGLKRRLRAWKHAQQGFASAESLMRQGDTPRFCGTLHDTVTGYLADMLNIEAGTLTLASLESVASRHGVSADLTARLRRMLELCDFARFSSEGTGSDIQKQLLDDAQEIAAALKEAL